MRGKISLTNEGKSFLKTEDGFSVFDNIRGSPRYWQKLRYDLVAKLEQLGPFQFFYTLSCADKRWDENIATLIMKNCTEIKVMHFMEEIGNYAIKLFFTDGHDTGLYSWDYLYHLAENYEALWLEYIGQLDAAGHKRNPSA